MPVSLSSDYYTEMMNEMNSLKSEIRELKKDNKELREKFETLLEVCIKSHCEDCEGSINGVCINHMWRPVIQKLVCG